MLFTFKNRDNLLDADDITIESWGKYDDLETIYYSCDEREEDEEENKSKFIEIQCTDVMKFICYLIVSFSYNNTNLTYQQICSFYDKNIINILKEKKMLIKDYENIKKNMEHYQKILDKVKKLYVESKAEELRSLVDKHFVPTQEEKEENAEISTPRELVDKMIDKIPLKYFKKINKTFEPCCGKGNFVLAIFEKFFYGLEKRIPDVKKRCKIIMKKCIYFADLTHLNVYITTELLKAHIKKFTGELPDYKFNTNIGNTLELDINDKWDIKCFDAIIGNPPYNKGKSKGFYQTFTISMLKNTNILLFVIPSNFTINKKGEKLVDALKNNGLKNVNFLTKDSFLNRIDIDTLYFLTIKDYNDEININDIFVSRESRLINQNNNIENSIFNKIMKQDKIELFRGKNKTLNYKNPVETDNIKFQKDSVHKNMLLSRLNGGRGEEIYWINSYKEQHKDNYKIVFPRGTASYNSINNLKNLTKDIVYNICVKKETILSNGLMYVLLDNKKDYEYMNKYLMRHKLIRFIFIRQNKYSELTSGLFKYIPKIPINVLKNDKIYEYLKFTEEEIKYIEEIFWKELKVDDKKIKKKTTTTTNKKTSEDDNNYDKYTKAKLIEIIKEKKIKGYSKLNKPELILLLKKNM